MLKNAHYIVLPLLLIVLTGCQTVKGAATGASQDIQSISNPDLNGWNALQKADAWVQQNMW